MLNCNATTVNVEENNLRNIIEQLTSRIPEISELHLFGSRRFKTGSLRSDVDVLVCLDTNVPEFKIRGIAINICPALDLFIVNGGQAISSINQSFIKADDFGALKTILNSQPLWTKVGGFSSEEIDWNFQTYAGIEFIASALPNTVTVTRYAHHLLSHLESEGLPTKPYVGANEYDIAEYLIGIMQRMFPDPRKMPRRSKTIWPLNFEDEYDYQDLFWVVTKPWFPELDREQIVIKYDGRDKNADFNLFGSRIIIEMKHIKDTNTQAIVLKTLDGLGELYKDNANVRVIIFAIFVDADVKLDSWLWESRYSQTTNTPVILTRIFRRPVSS